MPNAIAQPSAESLAHNPAIRGYRIVYREDEINFCPACGRSHWYIGRLLAECAFCATAIPLAEAPTQGAGGHSRNHKATAPFALAA